MDGLWVTFSDGGSRGNPGPAASGSVVVNPDGDIVYERGVYLGRQTNNVAEYVGAILALRKASKLGARDLEARLDSQLIVKQMTGQARVLSDDLRPLHQELKGLAAGGFARVRWVHIPREDNAHADRLCNEVLDAQEALRGEED